jgi:hypothetical protein
MSRNDTCVCRRMFKSRIIDRMAFSAAGLTAGLNPQNRCLSDGSMVQRGRKQYPRKSKLDVLITALSVLVLAVNDPGFGGMRLQLALCQSRLKRGLEGFGFLLTPTVHQSVIRIPTPRQVGMCPLHPKVESIVRRPLKSLIKGWERVG